MSLNIFYGIAGTGKSYAMMDDIKKRIGEGRTCIVIVPDQFTFEYEHLLYNHLGCRLYNSGAAEVLSFSRLANRIAVFAAESSAAPGKRNPPAASPAVKTAVMCRTIADIAKNEGFMYYDRQAGKPSFTRTALSMMTELICGGISTEKMADIAAAAPESMRDKLMDISLIYTKYSAMIKEKGCRDILLNMSEAAEDAERSGFFKGMYIYLDEFKSFTGEQYKLIGTILSQCEEMTVCMTAEDIAAGENTPFRYISETCGRLITSADRAGAACRTVKFSENHRFAHPELEHLAKNLFRSRPDVYNSNTDNILCVTAPDLYGECEYICAEIHKLVCETDMGLRYSDIAVLSRSMSDCIGILSSAFERYSIPYFSDSKPSAAFKPLMLFISSALELAASREYSTEAMLRYLKTGLAGVSDESISLLENYCYCWDIDGPLWKKPFPNEPEEAVRSQAVAPIEELKRRCGGGKAAEGSVICDMLRQLILDTGAEDSLLAYIGSNAADAEAAEEMREHERLADDLDKLLCDLERVLAGEELTLSEFRDIFTLAAESITLSSPPVSLDACGAQQSDLARLSAPKVVFVMGALDGMLPYTDVQSGTFTDTEREYFISTASDIGGGFRSRIAEEKFVSYKALTSASERLYITRPMSDMSGKSYYPAPLLARINRFMPQLRTIDSRSLGLLFFCGTEKSAYASLVENYGRNDPQSETVKRMLSADPFYSQRFSYIDSIGSSFSYQVKDRSLIPGLIGNTMNISASRFEDYSKCPFMFYCRSVLKIHPLAKNDLNPMNLGSVMHYCICGILEGCPKDDFIKLDDEMLDRLIRYYADEYITSSMGGSFAKNGSFYFYLERMYETLLSYLKHLQRELMETDFTPSDFEISIGSKGKRSSPLTIDIDGSFGLNFIGTADRVDTYTAKDGRKYIRIIDYKTGSKDFNLRQLPYGMNLQMFFYLNALTENSGKYAEYLPAGVLYSPVIFPKLTQKRPSSPDDDLREDAEKSLRLKGIILHDKPMEIAQAMEHGMEGRFIPVKLLKSGDPDKSSKGHLADENMFREISEHSKKMLRELGKSIYEGAVPASPLVLDPRHVPCTSCDYREICGNYPETHIRDVSDIDPEMFVPKNEGSVE
ncbi:MAG: PD-(D/E)XK nuclease family protein [Huintestinicola sp.]